mgnify:CR=1 FL=1
MSKLETGFRFTHDKGIGPSRVYMLISIHAGDDHDQALGHGRNNWARFRNLAFQLDTLGFDEHKSIKLT